MQESSEEHQVSMPGQSSGGRKSNFTSGPYFATFALMLKKILALLILPLFLVGCATQFTNLTPRELPRNADNLYPVEVQFDSRQQSLRWDSIEPTVIADGQTYPMRKVEPLRNRWECLLPVPAGRSSINYRYKFGFLCNEFGGPQPDTEISPVYLLSISDK